MPAPLCRYCGKPIKKVTCTIYVREGERQQYETDSLFIRYIYPVDRPRSLADCQKLSKDQVVSMRYGRKWDGDAEQSTGFVSIFTTWDGKSYTDDYFCNGEHARNFGYVCAREGRCTSDYNAALTVQRQLAATAATPGEDR
jgi:ribosomal protein L24E